MIYVAVRLYPIDRIKGISAVIGAETAQKPHIKTASQDIIFGVNALINVFSGCRSFLSSIKLIIIFEIELNSLLLINTAVIAPNIVPSINEMIKNTGIFGINLIALKSFLILLFGLKGNLKTSVLLVLSKAEVSFPPPD